MVPYEDKLNRELERCYLIETNRMDLSVMYEWFAIGPDFLGKDVGTIIMYHPY